MTVQTQKLTGYSMMTLGLCRVAAGIGAYIVTDSDTLEDALVTAALLSHGMFGLLFGAYTAGSYSQAATQGGAFTELVSSGLYTVCLAGGMGEAWAWWGLVVPLWYMVLIVLAAANPVHRPIKFGAETLVDEGYIPVGTDL